MGARNWWATSKADHVPGRRASPAPLILHYIPRMSQQKAYPTAPRPNIMYNVYCTRNSCLKMIRLRISNGYQTDRAFFSLFISLNPGKGQGSLFTFYYSLTKINQSIDGCGYCDMTSASITKLLHITACIILTRFVFICSIPLSLYRK